MFVHRFNFHVMLVLVTIAFICIVLPFYSAILWAVIFAILFHPIYARFEAAMRGRKNAAAAMSVLICLCLAIIPGLVVLGLLVRQANSLYQRIERGEIDLLPVIEKLRGSLPSVVQERIQSWGSLEQAGELSTSLLQGGSKFAELALNFGQNTLEFFISFGVMLYLLFFLFRDGPLLARAVSRALPLSSAHTLRFTSKFTSVVRATIRGNVIIAALQGAIGGLAFWALDIQPALLWGVLMSLLSLLPAVGAALIWLPAVVFLALGGLWVKAAILAIVGVLIIGLVDNLLRPSLVGKETRLPDYLVLLSTVGGISLIGINGFVIGPLIAAFFVSAWGIFADEIDDEQ
jgi:predicted PurR-regulated permease PerM